MKKKVLSLALTLVMCLSLAVPAFAADSDFQLKGTVLEKYKGDGGNVTIPSSVTAIANNAFKDCGTLLSVTIPEGVTSIGNSAFNGCTSLRSVTIPNSVTGIGSNAFNDCISLTRANILGATNVDDYAFSGCSSLTTAAFYNGKARLNERVFSNCTSLTTVYLPSEITEFKTGLFNGCTSLNTLYLPAGLTTIQSWVFGGVNVADIYYGGTADQWVNVSIQNYNGDIKKANVHCDSAMPALPDLPDNQQYAVPGFTNVAFEISGTTLKKYKGAGGDVTIPSGVTAIANNAFKDCDTVTSVTIPAGVTSIGSRAFEKCGALASVTIPEGVTSIGSNAFNKCESLRSVTIPASVTSIGSNAFDGCISLTRANILGAANVCDHVFFGCSSLTAAAFYDSKAYLDERVFSNCTSLTTVYLPSEISEFKTGLFGGCTSLNTLYLPASLTTVESWVFSGVNVADIYYGGTADQWVNVSIQNYNGDVKNANVHYNSEMPVPPPVFTDVSENQYYAAPVAWAVSKDITNGTGNGTFSPDQTCTQAQILTFLWRSQDEPSPAGTVSGTEYYAKAAQWAAEQGLTDNFSANADCTRAMVVTYLWRLAGSPKASSSGSFTDVPDTLADAVSWAAEQGITTGTSETTFSPENTCTRGQIVTFLYRAYK